MNVLRMFVGTKKFPCFLMLVVVSMLSDGAQGQGVRSSLDFGWKLQYTPLGNNCAGSNPFPNKLPNQQCFGLNEVNATTAQECEAACCAQISCDTYQFCSGSGCAPAKSCWIGHATTCSTGSGWTSGQSALPPSPSPTTCASPQCKVDFDDSNWPTVNAPHDFTIEGTFTPNADRSHGYLPPGFGWYRLHFTLPASAKNQSLWIQFDGVYRNSITYLNGIALGNHESGYTSFVYDISTAPLNFGGENILVVYADSTQYEGWWYEGGGLYRHVWLTIADPLHVKPWGLFAPSFVTGTISNVGDGQFATAAEVHVQSDIVNMYTKSQSFSVRSVLTDSNGKTLATNTSSLTLSAKGETTLTQYLNVQNVNLWSAESPTLYTVTTSIMVGGTTVDVTVTKIGIRKIAWDANKGLFINNMSVKIRGACNHQDFAGTGTAVPDRVNMYRVQRLKEMGANGWRMSHNPPNPELLDFTDSLGLYVMDENRNFADVPQYYIDAEDMVRRDRNHPSIIMWSLCNEAGCMEGDPNGANVGNKFKAIIKNVDPTRDVVAAMLGGWGIGLSTVIDAQGLNYNYGEYSPFHSQHPSQPMFGSETGSCEGARSVYVTDNAVGHLAIYNADPCMQQWLGAVVSSPYIAGGFSWTGFDYKGEPSPYNWPEIGSNYGALDICGFAKDTFYFYQSWYTNQTVLHLFPHWNWQQGTNVDVWAYSNAASVELFLNGVSRGVQQVPHLGRVGWTVPWAAGSIQAKAYNANKVTVATQTVATTGAPHSIGLTVDTATTIAADGHDVALITVEILDNNGVLVPTASNYVNFAVTNGVILGVGNGDPSSHEPDKAAGRSAFGGLARVVLQSAAGQRGTITLTATSEGLLAAKISVTAA